MFDYNSFRATIFAAFVAQDWDAVAHALTLMQASTGRAVLQGDPTPEQVQAWAARIVVQLAADAAYVDEHGDLHPRLWCHNPKCKEHGHAVRMRMARAQIGKIQELTDRRVYWGAAVPGVH